MRYIYELSIRRYKEGMTMKVEYARNLRDEINEGIAKASVDSLDDNFGMVMIDSNISIYVYRTGLKELNVDYDDISGIIAYGDEIRAVNTRPTDERYSLVAIEVLDKDKGLTSKYYLSDETHVVTTYAD